MSKRLAYAALLVSVHAPVAAQVPPAAPLVLHDVAVLAMTGPRIIPEVSVLVRNGRIAAIAPRDSLRVPEGAVVVEGPGRTLLPGLIEMHIHLRDRLDLDLLLGNGVTTARNMDGTPQVLEWRQAVREGRLAGPTILSGSPFLHRAARDAPDRFVATVEDARRMVRRYAEEGYDYVKIAELDDEPFYALMDEARELGIPVVGHIPNYELPLERILAERMASIEHVEELFRVYFDYQPDESKIAPFVELVRRSGVPISTLIHTEEVKNGLFEEGRAYVTPERLARAERYLGPAAKERIEGTLEAIESGQWERHPVDVDFVLRLVRELNAAGVVVVPGTDSGGSFVIPGSGLHRELALLARAGLTPFEVLRAATVNAATVLGLGDRKGSVEIGKDADLILVDGDPLQDLECVRAPVGMVLRGHWIDGEELARLRARTFTDAHPEEEPPAATR